MKSSSSPRLVAYLLVVTLLSGLLWAIVMPPWQIPDEPFYYTSVRLIAEDFGWLDPVDMGTKGTAVPLPIFAWLAMPVVVAFRDPNTAMYVLRFLGVLFSLGVVWLTYLAAREVFGEDDLVVWAAALTAALWPSLAVFHAEGAPHMVSNLGGALFFWGGVRVVRRGWAPLPVAAVLGGAPLAVLAATKGIFVLAPLALLPLFALWRPGDTTARRRTTERLAVVTATAVAAMTAYIVVAISSSSSLAAVRAGLPPIGWLTAVFEISGHRPRYLLATLWGAWGWGSGVVLGDGWRRTFELLAVGALTGLLILLVRLVAKRGEEAVRTRLAATAFLVSGAAAAFLAAISYGHIIGFGAAKWLFPAVVPIAVLAMAGLAEWVPSASGAGAVDAVRARRTALAAVGGFLAAFQAIVVWVLVIPRFYRPFPGNLVREAQNVWATGIAQQLVFAPRPAPLMWIPTYVLVQAALVVVAWLLISRLWRAGEGAATP